MMFTCSKCEEVFEAGNGVHVSVHEDTVGRVCPACIAGAETIQLILHHKAPGKPYTLEHVEVTVRKTDDAE